MTKTGPKGGHHTEETKAKISAARKKYYETHENYWKGKKFPKEMVKKQRESQAKYWEEHGGWPKHTLEERKKLSLARRAYLARNGGTWGNHTQESKDHHSKVLKERYKNDPTYKQKVREAKVRDWSTPEFQRKMAQRDKKVRVKASAAKSNPSYGGCKSDPLDRFNAIFNSLD